MKLNIDGRCMGNLGNMGAGGIIQDCHGRFQGTFMKHFGYGTKNKAELRALTERVKLCKALSFLHVDIESDSKVVVNWVLAQHCTVCYL